MGQKQVFEIFTIIASNHNYMTNATQDNSRNARKRNKQTNKQTYNAVALRQLHSTSNLKYIFHFPLTLSTNQIK